MKLLTSLLLRFRINALVAITATIAIVALKVEKDPLDIVLILLGSILGTMVFDLEYLVNAYVMEPASEFSVGLKNQIKSRNILGAVTYLDAHKSDIPNKLISSALFQVLLGFSTLIVIPSPQVFGTALVLAAYVQSFYQMYEEHETTHTLDRWFWFLKKRPAKNGQIIYSIAMGLFLVYILYQIS